MKKIKKYFINGVIIVCVLSLFSSAILWYEPSKKVNADEITTYYMEADTIGNNTINFYLYVKPDSYDLEENECYYYYGYNAIYEGGIEEGFGDGTANFLHYSILDKNDYKCFIYSLTTNDNNILNAFYFNFQLNDLTFDADGYIIPNIYVGNPFLTRFAYSSGYQDGMTEGYENGYGVGLETGYRDGITEGYAEGFNDGESSQIDVNFMQSIFTSLDAFFQIHFAPNLTIGELFLAPLIIWFVWFIIKQFKGGD